MRIPSFIRLGPGKNASARLLYEYEVDVIQGENIQILKTAMREGNPLFDGREGWGIQLLTEVVRAEREIQGQEAVTT